MPNTQVFSRDCLREQREIAGLSRTQLAFHLDRSEQTVYLWEVGRTQPTPDMLGLIASVLCCAINDHFVSSTTDGPHAVNGGPSKNASGGTRYGQQFGGVSSSW